MVPNPSLDLSVVIPLKNEEENVAELHRQLKAVLDKRGIGCGIYYPVPVHLQPCYAYLGVKEGSLPESEKASREVLALPIYPELTRDQQEAVVEAVADFYNGKS